MGVILWISKVLIWIALILAAAAIGLLFGAFFGIFMGPVKLFEWTRNDNVSVSTDSI